MSKQAEPELKECPFCAMVPRLITIPGFEPRSYVMCSLGCGACGPEINRKDASDRAVAAWNTRVPVDRVAPGVDQQDNEEIRLALEGMIAAFDVSNYGDASIVATTRECALSIAKRAVGWTFASPAPKEEEAHERPKIICLCGSTRFIEQFAITTWELEREGFIVLGCTLLPMWYCSVPSHFGEATGTKEQCDELHKRKIDLADEVLILNIGGYIGESTANEIAYATELGKPVRYLESTRITTPTAPVVSDRDPDD